MFLILVHFIFCSGLEKRKKCGVPAKRLRVKKNENLRDSKDSRDSDADSNSFLDTWKPSTNRTEASDFSQETYKEGDFILAKLIYNFGTKKETEKIFLGQIDECKMGRYGSGFKVEFLRKARTLTLDGEGQYYFVSPALKDSFTIERDQIMEKIPNPPLLIRGKYYLRDATRIPLDQIQ